MVQVRGVQRVAALERDLELRVHTALSRARAHTRVYLITEATYAQREREQYAPPEPERTAAEAMDVLTRAMRRREAELLAVQQLEGPDLPASGEISQTPLTELAEAGADRATILTSSSMSAVIRSPGGPTRTRFAGGREPDRDAGREH